MKTPYSMEDLLEQVEQDLRADLQHVFPTKNLDFRLIAEEFFSEERAVEQVELISSQAPFPLAGRKLLEVGSAYGTFLRVAGARAGVEAYGVEPAPDEFFSSTLKGCVKYMEVTRTRLRVAAGVGENLPFRDDTFDVVCSYNVLEHVRDPHRTIGEIVRVLAPGGCAVIVVPNYGSWWEGHYGILWIPHIPKWAARLYVRLYGYDPGCLANINFISVNSLKKGLAPHRERVTVLSWGYELWRKRLLELDIKTWASLGALKRMVAMLHKLKLQRIVAWAGRLLNWQTPIVLVFTKKSYESPSE